MSLYNSLDLYLVSLPHLGDLHYSTALSNVRRERLFKVSLFNRLSGKPVINCIPNDSKKHMFYGYANN